MTAAAANSAMPVPPALSGHFAMPPAADGMHTTPATVGLVRSQVQALLDSTDAYHSLPEPDSERIEHHLTHIASYAAECARDVWGQSEKLGQRPVIREREVRQGPLAQAAANPPHRQAGQPPAERPGSVNQVARVKQETVRAIAFPVFVADLIKGTFNAIIQSNIQQMEAFGKMLENVTKTVDEFMSDNITDSQARDWLQQRYPDHIQVKDGKAIPKEGADDKPAPNMQDLNLPGSPSLDEDSIEDQLVPAARRRIAESRLQILSTMVLMGVNRIVVTGGKIRATMGFHIDATDRTHEEHATDTDFRAAAAGSFGFGPWSVSASTSFSYVSSSKQNSDSDIHVDTDLTGEVEILFKSDYFPVQRFANAGTIGRIQQNTPVPEANALGETPATGGTIGAYKSPRTVDRISNASKQQTPATPRTEPLMPVAPTKPVVEKKVEAPTDSIWYDPSVHHDDAGGGNGKGVADTPATTPPPDAKTAPATPPAPADKSKGSKKGAVAKPDPSADASNPPPASPPNVEGASGGLENAQSYWQGAFA